MSSDGDIAGTLDASYYKGCGVRRDRERTVILDNAYCVGNGQLMQLKMSDKVGALNCMHDQQAVMVTNPAIAIDRASFNQGKNAQYDFSVQEELAQTIVARGPGGGTATVGSLCARDYKGVGNQYVAEGKCVVQFNDRNDT